MVSCEVDMVRSVYHSTAEDGSPLDLFSKKFHYKGMNIYNNINNIMIMMVEFRSDVGHKKTK